MEARTTQIQVDCMTKVAAAWNPSKQSSNGYKLEENSFWFSRNSLQPTGMILQEHIATSFWTDNGESL